MRKSNRCGRPRCIGHVPSPALIALAVALTLEATAALAQSAPAQDPNIRSIDPIVVTGTRTERSTFNLPMSIDAVVAPDIQDGQPRVNLSEALSRVPGIVVSNRQNYSQDLQVSSRGFGARSTFGIRGVRVIVDDIPATNPDGQGRRISTWVPPSASKCCADRSRPSMATPPAE